MQATLLLHSMLKNDAFIQNTGRIIKDSDRKGNIVFSESLFTKIYSIMKMFLL